MAKLTIQSDDHASVPGQENASAQKEAQQAKIEEAQANSLFKGRESRKERRLADGPDYTYSKIRLHKSDEINPYADQQDERYGFDPRVKKLVILTVALVAVFIVVCILPTNVFDVTRADRTIGTLAAETAASVQGFIGFFLNPNTQFGTYLLTVFVSVLAGAALALSGGVFQGALKNALASPSTLGVTNGGTIGAVVFSLFVYPNSLTTTYNGSASDLSALYDNMSLGQWIIEEYGSFLCTLVGCFVIVGLVMLIAYISGRGKVNNVALVVAGQVFASVITVIVNFVRSWYSNHGDVDTATYLMQSQTSSFTGAYTITSVLVFAIPLAICMGIVFFNASKLSLLAFKDEEARSMGISTTRTRNLVVAVCTVLTALVISYCGMIGFVGFIVPHIARKLIGPDFRYLLPACGLIGGMLVAAIFYITNLGIPFIAGGSTGAFTSLIGCIAFIVIALRGRRSSGGEWL